MLLTVILRSQTMEEVELRNHWAALETLAGSQSVCLGEGSPSFLTFQR